MVRELLLKFAIELPLDECLAIAEQPNINRAKEILAYEATKLAHGEAAAKDAYLAAGSKFGFADPENKVATTSTIAKLSAADATASLPETAISQADIADGLTVPRLLVLSGICKSTSDARRLIQGGAVSLDDVKVTDVNAQLSADDFAAGAVTLRAGKKNFRKVVLK
jgi:tyrosyl-tRNA synthetase